MIEFMISKEQAEDICKHYGQDASKLEDYEICELLDLLIDNALFGGSVN